ncbi:aldehyde dehydrogenase [Penicillium riverlandense]|uniref:aldehyde dehydrogenase n=1 Tax=Penicillium riverlandense TaxID=1903569 RepID=UPI002548D421|nr:aldehyde dehydrogenase [Penicillium riverlandense]KAJ5814946.1 aldehyde dehydrogenase [Penicillium riverlandense]
MGLLQSPHLLDGCDVSSGSWFDVHSPETGELVSQGARCTAGIADQALESAQAAFPRWCQVSYLRRRELLLRAADKLEALGPDIQAAMMVETGAKADWAGGANVHGAASLLREVASLASQLKGEILPSSNPGTMTFVFREPAGVVFAVAPWNSPVVLSCRAVATALLCGNTVILKSSECSPRTQRFVAEAFRDAGLPDGVLNYVNMAADESPALVERIIASPVVRRVNFTGSVRVGRIIARHCAVYGPKQCVVELGGKAAAVVLEDADLDAAADDIVFSSMMHSGQICFSIENVLVLDAVANALVERLKSRIAKLWAGATDSSTESRDERFRIGPLYNSASATHAVDLLRSVEETRATVLVGDVTAEQCFIQPHLLDHVDPSSRIFSEESFAPFCCITRISTVEEAIRLANLPGYSLSAAVYGTDGAATFEVARQIRSGAVHINGPTLSFESNRPYGGCGGPSGYGRFGGAAGIQEYTDLKVVTFNKSGSVKGSLV